MVRFVIFVEDACGANVTSIRFLLRENSGIGETYFNEIYSALSC